MAQAASSPDVVFSVRRCQPVLVAPAKPTPREFKLLSDIDNYSCFRIQIPVIHFYRHESSMEGKDPAQFIKRALAQTLVFYYPFAGRLREGTGGKLMVDCNGEGVIFIEADADVTLLQFGDPLQPPFPCFEELLYNVPDSDGIINCPLLLIQVTRLKCGGFIFAFRLNHTMSDGPGTVQFLKALSEITRGASEPSVPPVWRRELLNARDPPRITCTHREFEDQEVPEDNIRTAQVQPMVQRSFFFGRIKLEAIRQLFSHHNDHHTTFEVLTAFLWRCRTRALQLEPNAEVRLMFPINVTGKSNPPLLPIGYYGNAGVSPAAITTAKKLCENSFVYALELIKKAKGEATVEYIQSVADYMVIKGRVQPYFSWARSWIMTDTTRLGFRDVDFGWGKAVYSGPAMTGAGYFPGVSGYVACENAKGEEGIVTTLCLPLNVMKRFTDELDHLIGNFNNNQADSGVIKSSL